MCRRIDPTRHYRRYRFPLSDGGEAWPFILTRKLGRERTAELKKYGRAKGATLNDVVLTAYYRCLFQRLAMSPGTELQIPVMVDMRRYLVVPCKNKRYMLKFLNESSGGQD